MYITDNPRENMKRKTGFEEPIEGLWSATVFSFDDQE